MNCQKYLIHEIIHGQNSVLEDVAESRQHVFFFAKLNSVSISSKLALGKQEKL